MAHELRWLGHSGWEITTAQGRKVLIDPWLSENPVAPDSIEALGPAEYVLITHDHFDHASDAVAVAHATGATLVGQPEVVHRCQRDGSSDGKRFEAVEMNIGGSVDLEGLKVTMTDAYHSSESGTPAGYILTLENGQVIYHLGDTGLHVNMSTWGELFDIDVALVPIGDRFTMDGRQAAHALKWLKPKHALPMHYRTFRLLAQSAEDFVEHAKRTAPEVEIHLLDPGGTYRLT